MSEMAEQQPRWRQLSPSVQHAFEWAAASVRVHGGETSDGPMVVSGALLFGIIMSHRGSSEPEALLEHFGRTLDELFSTLQKQEEIKSGGAPFELDLSVTSPHPLDDLPSLSVSVEEILTRSWGLALSLDPAPDGLLHLPMLFGGILEVEDAGAHRALTEVLSDVPMERIYDDYLKYLSQGSNRPRFSAFLTERFPNAPGAKDGGPSDTARSGNLRGAVNDTVAVEDQLGFAYYVDAFAELIAAPDTHPPLTIGIYGSWGMGKSFLLRHIESRLSEEEFKKRPQSVGSEPQPDVHVVHFNAWEYSAAEVIWPGLVRKILDELEKTWSPWRRFATKFRRNVRRQTRQFRGRLILVALILAVVLLVALLQSGSDATLVGGAIAVLGVGGLVKLITDTLANPLGQYVTALAEDSDYGRHIGYMTEIRDDLEKLEERLRQDNGRILVVIDDLDRCEPEKAVEVLQAINLLLNFESFIVCLGIDARIITAAVEKHYENLLGEVGASGYEYLEKIVQIPFRIPQPGEEEIKTFISKQMGDPKPSSAEDEPDGSRPEREPQGERPTSDQESEPDRGAGRETPPEPTPPPSGELQADKPVPFTHDELKAFEDVASFLRPNPRHLKRLVNVYRLVRSLAAAKKERAILDKPAATIRWLVMCAQWPYTSHAMLWQFGEKLEEWGGRIPENAPAGDPLLYLLEEVSPLLSREKQRELDEDPGSLRELLEREDGRLTWEELRRIRQYTVNFNPAVEEEMWVLTAGEHPVESTGDGPLDTATSQAQATNTPT
jgi:Cdc6-like AAA superfamily ATPase